MAMVVMALQAAVLLTLLLTPTHPPARLTFFELLWASARRPTFYPLVALMLAGPVLTWLALLERGVHRRWLAVTWCAFLLAVVIGFGDRVAAMLRVMLWQVGG